MTTPTPTPTPTDRNLDENLILILRAGPPTEVPGGPSSRIQSAQSRAWTMSGDVD